MSQHIVVLGPQLVPGANQWHPDFAGYEDVKFVFGWDEPLQSFYLQKHDAFVEEQDANPIVWLGVPNGVPEDVEMKEVDDLAREAVKLGLVIPSALRGLLQAEKDRGI